MWHGNCCFVCFFRNKINDISLFARIIHPKSIRLYRFTLSLVDGETEAERWMQIIWLNVLLRIESIEKCCFDVFHRWNDCSDSIWKGKPQNRSHYFSAEATHTHALTVWNRPIDFNSNAATAVRKLNIFFFIFWRCHRQNIKNIELNNGSVSKKKKKLAELRWKLKLRFDSNHQMKA